MNLIQRAARHTNANVIALAIFSVTVVAVLAIRTARRPVALLQGCFHSVAHKGSGCAAISKHADGAIKVELTDIELESSPNLELLLSSAGDAFENTTVRSATTISLGPLAQEARYQVFELPNGVDLTQFHSVTVWNRKYQVNFMTAPLR